MPKTSARVRLNVKCGEEIVMGHPVYKVQIIEIFLCYQNSVTVTMHLRVRKSVDKTNRSSK